MQSFGWVKTTAASTHGECPIFFFRYCRRHLAFPFACLDDPHDDSKAIFDYQNLHQIRDPGTPHHRTEREAKQEKTIESPKAFLNGKKRSFGKVSCSNQTNRRAMMKQKPLPPCPTHFALTRSIRSSKTFSRHHSRIQNDNSGSIMETRREPRRGENEGRRLGRSNADEGMTSYHAVRIVSDLIGCQTAPDSKH